MSLIPLPNEPRTYSADQPGITVAPVGDQPEPVGPGFIATIGAAARQSNEIASFLSNRDVEAQDRYRIEDGFDLFKRLKDDKLEEQSSGFLDVFNSHAYEARRAQMEMETRDRRILDSAGFWGDLANLGAAIASPTTLLPGGQIYKGIKGGYAFGKSALSVGIAAGAAATAQEAGLQATQEQRTATESAFAIGGSALLGGLLGGGAALFLNGAERRVLAKGLDDLAHSKAPDEQFKNEGEIGSAFQAAGAQVANKATLEDMSIAGKMAGAVGKLSAKARLNPLVRILDSPNVEARKLGLSMMENPVYLRMNMEEGASEQAVESLVKEYSQGAVAKAMQETDKLYKEYRAGGGVLASDEFEEAIGKAMRRSDRSDVEQIAKGADAWRKTVFDPLKDQAIEAGNMPKDVKVSTAESYFSRLWNWRKIEANESKFKDIVRKHIDGEVSKAEIDTPSVAKERGGNGYFVSAADRAGYIDEIVDEVYNRITGRIDGDLPRDIVPTARGPLKERTFHIPDHLVEDFIEHNVTRVGKRYARIMAAEIELTKKHGSPDMKDALKRVQDKYVELRKAVDSDPDIHLRVRDKAIQKLTGTARTEAARAAAVADLHASEKADMRDLKAVRDMLRGVYMAHENATSTARVLAVANTFNYLRSMGGQTLSSLTDVARPMMVHGLGRYMRDGIVPLVKNLKAVKASVQEARLAGAVAERYVNGRMGTWGEISDPHGVHSPFERFLENTAKGFSKLTGMVYWNDFMKAFSATMTQTRILRGVNGYSSLNKREKAYLHFLGINEDTAKRIAAQFSGTDVPGGPPRGSIEDGVYIANTEAWTDVAARRAYRAAVNKDVDSIIVTKGIGDTPLFSHKPIGRAVLQFKSFALASHQRAFMRGLQEAPTGVIAGMITSTAIGMFIYWLKAVESNRADTLSDNPGHWLAEGLDRSGLFSVMFEVNNTVEKSLGIGAYGALQAAFPDKDKTNKASRYVTRSVAASFAGPTGDFADTLVKVVNGMKDGDMKEADVNAIRRLAPGGTLPVVRSILEYGVLPKARESVAD